MTLDLARCRAHWVRRSCGRLTTSPARVMATTTLSVPACGQSSPRGSRLGTDSTHTAPCSSSTRLARSTTCWVAAAWRTVSLGVSVSYEMSLSRLTGCFMTASIRCLYALELVFFMAFLTMVFMMLSSTMTGGSQSDWRSWSLVGRDMGAWSSSHLTMKVCCGRVSWSQSLGSTMSELLSEVSTLILSMPVARGG